MDRKNLIYLLMSRYITYIAVFISSVILLDKDMKQIVLFTISFIFLLVNSTIRIYKFDKKYLYFLISVFIELLTILFMQYAFSPIAFIYFYIIIVDIFLILKLKQAVAIFLPVFAGTILCSLPLGGSTSSILLTITINGTIAVFFAGASYVIKNEFMMRAEIQSLYDELKRSKEELEDANRKLGEYAAKVEEVSILSERNRIAGEIHDTIGHNLTALIMEIDICSKLIDKDVQRTKQELIKTSELARSAMNEVRRSVKAIKPSNADELTGIHAIEELVRDFEKSTNIIVRLDISKNMYKLSPAVDVTIYHMIQEALTNCAKHGNTDSITVRISFNKSSIELAIKDNGTGCSEFVKGFGLTTMEERIQSLGGEISFAADNGFYINAVIPVEVE